MKTVFAWSEPGDVGDDFHRIAGFREGDGADDFAVRSGTENRDGFLHILRNRKRRANADDEREKKNERAGFHDDILRRTN